MTRMKPTAILLSLLIITGACMKQPEATPIKPIHETQKDDQYKNELEEIRKNIKSDLKIKLKKDGKGDAYSWEISGKDAGEILKANDILSRKLTPK
jgi:hypothetical protein